MTITVAYDRYRKTCTIIFTFKTGANNMLHGPKCVWRFSCGCILITSNINLAALCISTIMRMSHQSVWEMDPSSQTQQQRLPRRLTALVQVRWCHSADLEVSRRQLWCSTSLLWRTERSPRRKIDEAKMDWTDREPASRWMSHPPPALTGLTSAYHCSRCHWCQMASTADGRLGFRSAEHHFRLTTFPAPSGVES